MRGSPVLLASCLWKWRRIGGLLESRGRPRRLKLPPVFGLLLKSRPSARPPVPTHIKARAPGRRLTRKMACDF